MGTPKIGRDDVTLYKPWNFKWLPKEV